MRLGMQAARKQSGKTQLQVATEVGIQAAVYQRYEYGQTEPGVRTALRIADALKVDTLEGFKALFGAATPDTQLYHGEKVPGNKNCRARKEAL